MIAGVPVPVNSRQKPSLAHVQLAFTSAVRNDNIGAFGTVMLNIVMVLLKANFVRDGV